MSQTAAVEQRRKQDLERILDIVGPPRHDASRGRRPAGGGIVMRSKTDPGELVPTNDGMLLSSLKRGCDDTPTRNPKLEKRTDVADKANRQSTNGLRGETAVAARVPGE